jgi:hypothetical protein
MGRHPCRPEQVCGEARLPIHYSQYIQPQAMVWALSCTRNRMFEDKYCNGEYVNGDAQFATDMKVTTVKANRQVEQCGPK